MQVNPSEDAKQPSGASEKISEPPTQVPSENVHPQPSPDQSQHLSSPTTGNTQTEEVTAPQAPETPGSEPISDEDNSKEPPPENLSEHEDSIHEKSETEVNDDLSRKESGTEDKDEPVPVIDNEANAIPNNISHDDGNEAESPPIVVNGLNENSNNVNLVEDKEEGDEMFAPPKEKNDVNASTPTKTLEGSSKKEKVSQPSTADTTSREPPPLFDDDDEDDDDR